MPIDTTTAVGARDFAYSWVDTADQMNRLPEATPVENVQPIRRSTPTYEYQVDRIQPTIFEWLFWSQIFSSPRQNTYNTYNVTNVYAGSTNETTEKREEESGISWKMVIAGVTVLFAAVIGLAIAVRELYKANQLIGMAKECLKNHLDDAIAVVARNALEILERRVYKLTGYSISTAGLLVGGAAMFVGGFFAIPIVGQVGVVVTVLFTVCLLYAVAAHWSDSDEDLPCYKTIQSQHDPIDAACEVRAYEERNQNIYQPHAG